MVIAFNLNTVFAPLMPFLKVKRATPKQPTRDGAVQTRKALWLRCCRIALVAQWHAGISDVHSKQQSRIGIQTRLSHFRLTHRECSTEEMDLPPRPCPILTR